MEERLKIFEENGVISVEIINYLRELIIDFDNKGYETDTPAMEMLITHFGMALMRISNDQACQPLDEMIYSEVKQHDKYNLICELYTEIDGSSPVKLCVEEEGYIKMHLANVINTGGN